MEKKTNEAILWLPTGAKEYWSTIMSGEAKFPYSLYEGDIIVAAYARFDDGTQVIGGVRKSNSDDFNIKFFHVMDALGNVYPDLPIDCSDHENFRSSGFGFILNEEGSVEYHLAMKEQEAVAA
jgi:hypothetical protein